MRKEGEVGMRRCEECSYLYTTGGEYPETYCPLVSEEDEKFDTDDEGYSGCRYNMRTLKKKEREHDEAEYRSLLGYDDFMLTNSIDMTEEDSKILNQIMRAMMHTIGMWPEGLRHPYKRHGKIFYRPYRNHFDTAPNCYGYWMWERMEKAGHAEAHKTGNGEMWHLTRRGLDWLEMKLQIRIYDEEE